MDGSELTALFEYDDEQTAKNVSEFFKNFKRISRMAGEDPSVLKSPVITDMPVSHDGGNHNEDRLVEHANATDLAPKIVNDVKIALSHVSETSRTIIIGLYVDDLTNRIMAQRLGYSERRVIDLKKKALNEFADSLEAQEQLHINLHVTNGNELVCG
ncbi:MAG: ArpU family transcriptional regulator [Firmicutes bacterium]|uniref:ArpU family transcriptional regulator n=1 Tax=Candidatus Gallilactobacillus intestinavium TaxID=2840838 RepID=A0A9D9E4I4_9LACO|nr:ArpU family transcriptional regulator [Candidatus Gallilactobacillus intestinavium]